MSISKIEILRKRRGNLRKVGIMDLRSYLVSMLYWGLVLALRFNLRPMPSDLYNQTGGMRFAKGICESSAPNPTDADEHKTRWRYALFT